MSDTPTTVQNFHVRQAELETTPSVDPPEVQNLEGLRLEGNRVAKSLVELGPLADELDQGSAGQTGWVSRESAGTVMISPTSSNQFDRKGT